MKIKIPFIDSEKVKNPITVNQSLEFGKKCQVPRDNSWGDLCLTDFEKSVWGLFESDLLLYSKKKLKEKLVNGEYRDIVPSCGGSDATYFPDKITEPYDRLTKKIYPDGREKKKAATMW